ncbi:MAG TPA: stage II sporulation protein M [Chthonomonas sp.]|uniref:stage II sporulation protein M n=1 Tax=Chthonomonas sp. TaxID=2282153 RepID=UPI002B4AFFD9|nr:stage II sporulation protein M [Chthonomonas sp.]HLH80007.1 stage II sporulation protein M [Chthonomonas sp.]
MNEQDFVNERQADWQELSRIVRKADTRQGVRALDRGDLLRFMRLYRRVSSDLAYASAQALSEDIVGYLNGLVGRAQAILYEAETSTFPLQTVRRFYLYEFPTLLQRRCGYFLAALAIFLVGVGLAYWMVITSPPRLNLFIPKEFQASVRVWKSGKIASPPSAAFSGMLMTHNFQVAVMAYATGPALCVPSAYLLFYNGAVLGAMSALMTQVHRHATFWPGILPHGVAEITATLIAGAAGLMMGAALLFPGPYRRREAFLRAGKEGVQLLLGTIPLFVFAGLIEGMFSHLALPAWLRLTFAGLNGVFWYLYLFLPRRLPVFGKESEV